MNSVSGWTTAAVTVTSGGGGGAYSFAGPRQPAVHTTIADADNNRRIAITSISKTERA